MIGEPFATGTSTRHNVCTPFDTFLLKDIPGLVESAYNASTETRSFVFVDKEAALAFLLAVGE